MFKCCSKSSLTSLLSQEKIESKSLTFWIQIRSAQTYLTQNANNFFIRTLNWAILFLLESRFRSLFNPIGFTFKYVRSVEIWTKQSDTAAESESNNKSKGVASPPLIEARVSRSFDEMITIDLVESTLTIRLQTCTTLRLSNR